MTVRQAYEYLLVELNKVKSPHLHLEDFLYYLNKAVQEFENERYNMFAVSQQLTDDLSALSKSVAVSILNGTATILDSITGVILSSGPVLYSRRYNSIAVTFQLPDNYQHLLSSHCSILSYKPYKCYGAGYLHSNPAKRLSSDIAGGIMNNSYLKPDLVRPYYMIADNVSGGSITPMITILYGNYQLNQFSLTSMNIDYLKKPELLTMTVAQRDAIIDNSNVMEFTDYVCNEIIKRAVKLVLENSSDVRLQTNPVVNNSIQP